MSPENQGVFQLLKKVTNLQKILFRKYAARSFIFLIKSEDFAFELTPYTDVHGVTST